MNRMKIVALLVVLASCFQWSQQSIADESLDSRIAAINNKTGPLRNWCIFKLLNPNPPVEKLRLVTFHYKPTVESSPDTLLYRPEKDLRCVAVIRKHPDEKLSLNPEGYNYGPIPPANELTVSIADQLFGEQLQKKEEVAESDVERSYKLCLRNGETCTLDLTFKGSKCEKFRVHNPRLGSPQWFYVN